MFFRGKNVIMSIQKTLAVLAACSIITGQSYCYSQLSEEMNDVKLQEERYIANINALTSDNVALSKENTQLRLNIQQLQEEQTITIDEHPYQLIASGNELLEVEATAYTDGGLTANGFNLSGLSREEAMVIAVDPAIIPLGTQVYITFDEPYSHYNGVYTASDTGGAIYGNIIDVFVGHGNEHEANQFGRRRATVEIL